MTEHLKILQPLPMKIYPLLAFLLLTVLLNMCLLPFQHEATEEWKCHCLPFKIFYCLCYCSCPTFPPFAPCHKASPHFHTETSHHSTCPRVMHMFLTNPFPSSVSPHFPPPLWSLSACSLFPCLWFSVARLFCWLGSTYRWDYMVFVFYHLAYFS